MEKSVLEYLQGKGYAIDSETGDRGSSGECGNEGYVEWFNAHILGLDSETYRREFWREAYATGHTIGHVPRTLGTLMRELHVMRGEDMLGFLLALALLQGAVWPFWVLGRLVARELVRLRRSTYYERERERRWRLADERTAIRLRRTAASRPSIEEIRAAWEHVRSTRGRNHVLAILRCGALLEDLEGYVDNHAYVVRGVPGIRGRAPGIKGLFRAEAVDLFTAYKSVMRCKALAKRYRQAVGCPDPVPIASVLPMSRADIDRKGIEVKGPKVVRVAENTYPEFPFLENLDSLREWMKVHGNTSYLRTQSWVRYPEGTYTEANLLQPGAQAIAAEVLSFGDGTLVALAAAIALRIDPRCVDADPALRIRTLAGGERVPNTSRRVREWLNGVAGRRARRHAAA